MLPFPFPFRPPGIHAQPGGVADLTENARAESGGACT